MDSQAQDKNVRIGSNPLPNPRQFPYVKLVHNKFCNSTSQVAAVHLAQTCLARLLRSGSRRPNHVLYLQTNISAINIQKKKYYFYLIGHWLSHKSILLDQFVLKTLTTDFGYSLKASRLSAS